MAIAILGPGGVGGFLAAALHRNGADVRVVARESTAQHIAEHGIEVRSVALGDFVAHPPAVSALDTPTDVLIVASKATGLTAALDRVHTAPALIVPLLNGLDHMTLLRARFDRRTVAAGTIRIEADRPAPGHIVQTSPAFRVELASDQGSLRAPLNRLAATLQHAAVPTAVSDSEPQILWSKLVRLCALALTTSAADRPLGELRADPVWHEALLGSISEAAAVANADGAALDPAATIAELEEAHPGLGSSMRRDIAAGREPELDAIAGAVLRAGVRHAVPCPTIHRLAGQVAQRAGISAPFA